MVEHTAEVTVEAPAQEVWTLFSHFNDYPKFMRHIKEVTYYDDERSHWVVDLMGQYEWDAVNEGWVEGQQIGWRSTDGLRHTGRVTFEPQGADATRVAVWLTYDPPSGALGDAAEALGAGARVEAALREDLLHFAQMVREAPPGALDPTSSNYLFHEDSAARRGKTTAAQDRTMIDSSRADTAADTTLDPERTRSGIGSDTLSSDL